MKRFFSEYKTGAVKILLSVLLLIEAATLAHFGFVSVSVVCYAVSYGIIAYGVIFGALKKLFQRLKIDEELLMSVASLGAMIIGEYFEGILVLVLYSIGEIFEDVAMDSSRASLSSLAKLRPDKARLLSGEMVPVEGIQIGDIIEVYAGERIPLDGDVVESAGSVDTSLMTGESMPVSVRDGSEVLSGYLNCEGVLKIKVKRTAKTSAAQRIIDLSENALEKKTRSEKFISAFAKVYTPVVILLSLAMAIVPPLFDGYNFAPWAYRAFSMLAISCPCAIVISVPLAYFCGVSYAAKNGILIKGSSTIDALSKVKNVAFDKTGTLTKGELHVNKIEPVNGIGKAQLLRYACIAELKSNHPIALALISKAKKLNITLCEGENYNETVGFGIECDSELGHIKAGSKEYINAPEDTHANVYISLDGKYIGSISLGDEVKANSKIAFENLTRLGIKNKIILSGDKRVKVKALARSLLADKAYAELTPDGKLEVIEDLKNELDGYLAYCGDGINDTPAIARADVGIAMGALGSDSAVECSDVVIMDDDIDKVSKAIKIAKHTKAIVISNIILSLAVKAAMLTLSALGLVPMLGAVISDVGLLVWAIIIALFAGR